jgi:hypothetical protein
MSFNCTYLGNVTKGRVDFLHVMPLSNFEFNLPKYQSESSSVYGIVNVWNTLSLGTFVRKTQYQESATDLSRVKTAKSVEMDVASEKPNIHIPPRKRRLVENAFQNQHIARKPRPSPAHDPAIHLVSDPASISANQCQCCLTTQVLATAEDAVYSAAFGSHPSPTGSSIKRFLRVASLRSTDAIPLSADFSARLQGCHSVPFNIFGISAYVEKMMVDMYTHPELDPAALLW